MNTPPICHKVHGMCRQTATAANPGSAMRYLRGGQLPLSCVSIACLIYNASFPASAFLLPGARHTCRTPHVGITSDRSAIREVRAGETSSRRSGSNMNIITSGTGLEKQASSDTYEILRSFRVKRASSGEEIDLVDAWEPTPGKKTIVAFFTHTADFNSWEYAQKLRYYLPQIDDAGVAVVGVSLGKVEAARDFCAETGFPLDSMYMDEEGAAYSALGFSNGFDPRLPGDKKLNPYLRLLPMLAGIGSPGTIEAVLKGYVGDPNANADWISSAMTIVDNNGFEVLGKQGSRPLELATLRLQNMRQIVTKWNKLAPPNKELITQQGGTVVFEGRVPIYSFKDKGILVYTDVLSMLEEIGVKV